MSQPIKALLVDVDGTLIRSDLSISLKTEQALRRVEEFGVQVCLCTGRQYPTLGYVFDRIGRKHFHVVAGGAQVVAAETGKVAWERCIDSKTAHQMVHQVMSLGSKIVLGKSDAMYGHDNYVAHTKDHPWGYKARPLKELGDDWTTPLIVVQDLTPATKQFLKTQTKVHAIEMQATGTHIPYYDLTAVGVTKQEGVEKWSEFSGIDLSLVVGVGDGLNDREFLARVGMAVAMGNAEEEIKAIAQKEVLSNDEDGVAELASWIIEQVTSS